MPICLQCKIEKTLDNFEFIEDLERHHTWCNDCKILKLKPYKQAINRLRYLSKKKNRKKNHEAQLRYQKKYPEKQLLARAKTRSNERGHRFNLDISDIKIPEYCPILGLKLITRSDPDDPTTLDHVASIDKIVSELGYVKGNVQIISYRANQLKNDASVEEMELITKWFKKNKKNICQIRNQLSQNYNLVQTEKYARTKSGIPICQCDLNGNIIKEWPSATEAANNLKCSVSNLYNCLSGKSEVALGFKWKKKYE